MTIENSEKDKSPDPFLLKSMIKYQISEGGGLLKVLIQVENHCDMVFRIQKLFRRKY